MALDLVDLAGGSEFGLMEEWCQILGGLEPLIVQATEQAVAGPVAVAAE